MILGWQLYFCFCHHFKNIITFLCWFVFLVFNTLQQKTRSTFLLKSNIINNIQWQRCCCWVTVMSQCLLCPFDILLAHAVHRWISFIGNKTQQVIMSSGQLWWDFSGHLKKSFSSELKCLHYSNTNRRNYNIIIIIIIIIHLGLSPVQYNNKQNPFSILLLETLLNVKCVYIHNLALYSFPVPSLSLYQCLILVTSLSVFTALGHCRLSLFSRGIWGGKKKKKKKKKKSHQISQFLLKHSPWQPGT